MTNEDWIASADDYWRFVVKCLVAFHGMEEAKATASCSELRTLLEAPVPDIPEEDDFKWLYLHREPCNMADSVSMREGGHKVFNTDENLERYIAFREKEYRLSQIWSRLWTLRGDDSPEAVSEKEKLVNEMDKLDPAGIGILEYLRENESNEGISKNCWV